MSKKQRNPVINLLVEEWKHLGHRRKYFVLTCFLFVVANLIHLLTPLIIGMIFNSVQQSVSTNEELRHLIFLISLLLFVNIGFWAFQGLGRYVETRNGFYTNRNYINSKIGRVLELPVKWHKDHHSGDTIDKINKGASGIFYFSSHMTFRLISALVYIFGSLFVLLLVDFKIAVFALIYSCIILTIIFRLDLRLINYYRELNKKSNRVSAGIYDYVGNVITIITLRLKGKVQNEINLRIMESEELSKKASIYNEIKWGFASIAVSFMVVASLSYKAYSDFTLNGVILVGTLYILYGYLRNVGETFFQFAGMYGEITRYSANLENAKPIDEAFDEIRDEFSKDLSSNWNEIYLKNVGFSYSDNGKLKHIDEVDFKFLRGEKIALVGESGSGKSTMLTLLRGLYSPAKGKVFCDGIELDKGFSRLKRHVTLIPQDPEIFNDTIKNNITMGVRCKKEELMDVIKIAQLRNVVARLENGLETNVLEKGVSLSGGEKQRLALARGLLAARRSDVILLDEPTSSVDSENEMKIHDNIFSKFKGKTIISSIHRLHLLDKFDRIYLLREGRLLRAVH
jgi:ATP-binding cassette, subfamily B, bacterial